LLLPETSPSPAEIETPPPDELPIVDETDPLPALTETPPPPTCTPELLERVLLPTATLVPTLAVEPRDEEAAAPATPSPP
jgi:hypothetical protein